jgi:hypothetical protein
MACIGLMAFSPTTGCNVQVGGFGPRKDPSGDSARIINSDGNATGLKPLNTKYRRFFMRQFIVDSYKSVMDAKYNPLRHLPNEDFRHAILLGLMWMWAGIFAVGTGTVFFLGASMFFHALLLFGLMITLGSFNLAGSYGTNKPMKVR